MTRFSLLPVGARFAWEDAVYIKVNPLLAAEEKSNRQRMVPKSAVVEPLDVGANPAPEATGIARLRGAVDDYHARCLELLEAGADKETIHRELETARTQLLAQLVGGAAD